MKSLRDMHPRRVRYQIFVDMDGTIVDFEPMALSVVGYLPDHEPGNEVKRKHFWKSVEEYVKCGNTFFESMLPMVDAGELWSYVDVYDPIILTATGSLPTAKQEKYNWVLQYLGLDNAENMIQVRDAVDKAKYAAPTYILIDDRHKAINPWIAAGGIGILHTSAADTIRQLKEIGL